MSEDKPKKRMKWKATYKRRIPFVWYKPWTWFRRWKISVREVVHSGEFDVEIQQ